jgi:hypothetical protein
VASVPEIETETSTSESSSNRVFDEERFLARFFATLAVADREAVLGALLSEIGVEIARSELPRLQIQLSQPYYRATPSVLLEGESTLVFIESGAGLANGAERLVAEFQEGLKGSSLFSLVVITGDAREPAAVMTLREALAMRHKSGRVIWASWRRLYKTVYSLAKAEGLDEASRRLMSEHRTALEECGLASFVGFDPETHSAAAKACASLREVLSGAAIFGEETSAAVETGGLAPFHVAVRAEGQDTLSLPTHVTWTFRDEAWEGFELARCFFYVKLFLESPLVWVGYRIELGDAGRRAFVTEKRGVLAPVLEAREDVDFVLQNGEDVAGIVRSVRAGQGGLGFLETRDALVGVAHADLVLARRETDLTSPRLPMAVAEDLAWLRAQVQAVALYPNLDTEPTRRFVITNV